MLVSLMLIGSDALYIKVTSRWQKFLHLKRCLFVACWTRSFTIDVVCLWHLVRFVVYQLGTG
uniref:Uncharacterized protein n=1 Tax=Manihot esculenta TaxID=3983 RepID=A0A2C9UZ73_MANES